MKTRIRLLSARLHYESDIRVFTAASGPVDALHELYLVLERDDGLRGCAEVRANITFLTKVPEERVAPAIRALVEEITWSASPENGLDRVLALAPGHPPIARAIVESALVDAIARRDGVPVATVLGGDWRGPIETNNCFMLSSDEVFDRLSERFVGDGFRFLKVRLSLDNFDRDLARVAHLHERFGERIRLSVDANGAWPPETAIDCLRRLEKFGLEYIEQPTPPGDWDAFRRVGESTSIPVMLDEGLRSDEDVEQLARLGAPYMAHLKIAKLGGPRAVVAIARRLRAAGVGMMMGQMNEGAMASALALHCAMAVQPDHNELYGCYGLIDDPTTGLSFDRAKVVVANRPGLGVDFDESRATVVWEIDQE